MYLDVFPRLFLSRFCRCEGISFRLHYISPSNLRSLLLLLLLSLQLLLSLCMSEIKTSDYKCWTNTRNHVVSLVLIQNLKFGPNEDMIW